jgi:hypothetical protein
MADVCALPPGMPCGPATCPSPLQAEKWEMLLPALALEYVTGQPASFVQSQVKYYRSRNAITGGDSGWGTQGGSTTTAVVVCHWD